MIFRILLILSLVGCVGLGSGVMAASKSDVVVQDDVGLPDAAKFTPVGKAPKFVTALMPAKAESVFCGFAQIPDQNGDKSFVLIHCYLTQPVGVPPQSTGVALTNIDIFQRAPSSQNYQLTSSFRGDSPELQYSECPLPIFMDWTWVDPKTRQIPLIRLCCYTHDGFYGPFGTNIFLTFADGLGEKPELQFFLCTGDHSQDIDWFFGGLDERKFRYFVQILVEVADPEQRQQMTRWSWNPKKHRFEPPLTVGP